MGSIMKVHQFTRGFWEHEPSLSLGCKRLRPLAPKLSNPTTDSDATAPPPSSVLPFDLKSFIKPESGSRKLGSSDDDHSSSNKRDPPSPRGQVETHVGGGTRWNPTQEQIGILEMLYKGGMRTPNAQQIEHITSQLGKYGKIEGKNVFYWFQNHKARERQKHKRNNTTTLGLIPHSTTHHITTFANAINFDTISTRGGVVDREREDSPYKKCRNWAFEYMEEQQSWSSKKEEQHKTLELFPLHPEAKEDERV